MRMLNISLPSFDEGDSVLIVQRGDTCILSDNLHLKRLKVEAGSVVYLPVGNIYVGDVQFDVGGEVWFNNPEKNTFLWAKGRVQWRSNFFYNDGPGFIGRSAAESFMFLYLGENKIFIDKDWYGTVIAPNAEIVLGQTHNKELYGQFYADIIVVHQYSQLENVPFKRKQKQLEYVFDKAFSEKMKGENL